eukprot:4238524-Pleurochrysis_carterae.AAC.1
MDLSPQTSPVASHLLWRGETSHLSPTARACSCCGEGCFVETPPIAQSSEARISDELGLATAADIEQTQCGQKVSPKKRGFGQGGGSNGAVEEGIGHGELALRKEGLMPVERDRLLLQPTHGAAQILRLDHVSAGPEVYPPNVPKDVVA